MNQLVRSATTPAMTTQSGWAEELATVSQAFLASLVPLSAGADLLRRCLQVSFGRAATIMLPAINPGAAKFIGQDQEIPVPKMPTTTPATLTPAKLMAIIGLTREMLEGSNAEALLSQALLDSAAIGLDEILFSNAAAVADVSPAGLLHGATVVPPSANTIPSEAAVDDVSNLVGAISTKAGNGSIVFVAAPQQATRLLIVAESLQDSILMTAALPKGNVIAVATNAIASALEPIAIETSKGATIQEDTTTPSSDPTAGPRRSFFQTDAIGLRMRLPISWATRDQQQWPR